jgi:hypothetical protein
VALQSQRLLTGKHFRQVARLVQVPELLLLLQTDAEAEAKEERESS